MAEQDAAICGTLQVSYIPSLTFRGGERAQIEAVRVDGRLRGQGIGCQMVEWVVIQARGWGAAWSS